MTDTVGLGDGPGRTLILSELHSALGDLTLTITSRLRIETQPDEKN